MAQTYGSEETNFKKANAITSRSGNVVEPTPTPRENEKEPIEPNEINPSEELKHHIKKIAFLTEKVSAVIEQRIPQKYKDLGCPIISYVIGNRKFAQAHQDLRASVNLMPYAIYLLLGLEEMKPTSVVLQLAGRSTIQPRGVVEDVLVQVDKFHNPIDFLVLDVKVEVDVNSKIPIILGRPFLLAANALINYRNGLIKLTFENMTLEVNIFYVTQQPTEDDECYQTYMIDTFTQEEASTTIDSDPLNSFLLNSEILYGFNVDEYANICVVFTKLQDRRTSTWQPKFDELAKMTGGQKPSSIENLRPKLKQLSIGLKHVFLGPRDIFPVIISSELDAL
ncbi:uncharacterized protein LOC111373417 [Olea europaea var. sylvestris]|uniref:uncharacterized protein LOC111373417 n=1 Tax=Olea europaea var. sylvestris TaxID=158386 RepID=UPI000C1CECBC|nr:uncharacterized protein LOC111373417 [Olea europaea var. sylvestris]